MKKAVKRAAPAGRCQRLPPPRFPFAGSARTWCCWGESGEVTVPVSRPCRGPPDGERGDGGQDCLRAAITARSQLPGAPMLVLSQYVEASHAADLLADPSGAVGYLLKNRVAKVEEFLDAWTGLPAA
jgi:hypothetical protein